MAKYFEGLDVFRESRALTNSIYRITAAPEFSRDFGLRDQIHRAAVSVMSNVAEGFERGGNQEFMQFLYIAKGSCGEVRATLCGHRSGVSDRGAERGSDRGFQPSVGDDQPSHRVLERQWNEGRKVQKAPASHYEGGDGQFADRILGQPSSSVEPLNLELLNLERLNVAPLEPLPHHLVPPAAVLLE